MKQNNIYCLHCGKKNNIENKVCSFCNKKLNEKDHEFRDYLKDKLKDEIPGTIEDNFFSYLSAFLKKYLYGILVSISIVTVTTTILVTREQSPETIVTKKPVFKSTSIVEWLDGCWQGLGDPVKYVAYKKNMNLREHTKWFVITNDEKKGYYFDHYFSVDSTRDADIFRNQDGTWSYNAEGYTIYSSLPTYHRVTCSADAPTDWIVIKLKDIPDDIELVW